MSPSIEYQKVMTEIVYINMPAPEEPRPGMSGMDILHGFLGELGRAKDEHIKSFVDSMCLKWNVHFRNEAQSQQ